MMPFCKTRFFGQQMGNVFRLALSLTLASINECAFHDWLASLTRVSGAPILCSTGARAMPFIALMSGYAAS